jgi:hypothetical protein
MTYQRAIVIVDAFGVEHQLVKVVDVLPDDPGHLLQLRKLVPVVLCEHAPRAHYLMAGATEVLDFLLRMPGAVDCLGAAWGEQVTRVEVGEHLLVLRGRLMLLENILIFFVNWGQLQLLLLILKLLLQLSH